jgi:D-tyrosyl-tRNA(Tyr) deacylase
MKAVIQRVKEASVEVNGEIVSKIGPGIVTLLGFEKGDLESQLEKLITKIIELRIFSDSSGKMNLSLVETGFSHLIVSQFTLAGDCGSGRRPSFTNAEKPEIASTLFEKAVEFSKARIPTHTGIFQADMKVSLINDGPVTFSLSM